MPKQTLFKKINNNFIETGAFLGDGIQKALDSGFEKIISIELSEHYANVCKRRYMSNSCVEVIIGDSYFELQNTLEKYSTANFTYWLDGHFSGGDTAFGVKEFPIMEELEAILKRNIADEIIYVDDMRILRDFNSKINLKEIESLVLKFKPGALLELESSQHDEEDVLVIQY